jgi:hypothetical protein
MKYSTKTLVTAIPALLLGFSVFAQQEEGNEADPAAPPPIPPKLTPAEDIAPSVIIREEEDRMIEEYSRDGRVYMVKVTPKKGPPYWYFDEDGDGLLELQPGNDLGPVRPAYWKIKEWK